MFPNLPSIFLVVILIISPVALASYTVSGIAESDPLETGFTSSKIGLVAFLNLYMLIYALQLFAQGIL